MVGGSVVDDAGQVEDGQEHTDDHAADDDAEEHDEEGFQEGHEAGEGGVDFFVEEVGDAFEHGVDVTGLFTCAEHADDHIGENGVLGQGLGDAFAAFDVLGGGFDGFFHEGVADGLGDDLEDFQDGYTAADEGSEGAGEPGETDFVGDGPKDGQFEAVFVPKIAAGLGFDVVEPAPDGRANNHEQEDEIVFHHVADAHQNEGGTGQSGTEPGINFLEGGNNSHEEEGGDANGDDGHDGGIHQGGFDLFTEAFGVFLIGGEARQDFREETAFFAGSDHGHIEAVEGFGMAGEGFGEAFAAFHTGGDVADGVAHDFVGRLIGEGLQSLHNGDTGIDHGGELARENDEVGEGHLAAFGLSALGELFLDLDDEHVAIEQGGDGGLFGGGFDGIADFAAGGRFAGSIGV
jgi:hypothetical protein